MKTGIVGKIKFNIGAVITMIYRLGYGKSEISFELDSRNVLCELHPNRVETGQTGRAEVERSLRNPIGSKRLYEIVKPGEKVAIITSDITRPMPSAVVLPPVLEELLRGGAKKEDILIVFALGSHRAHTEEEKKYLVGEEIYREFRCIDSIGDFVHLGVTASGTPADIFALVAQADRVICLGNIEYHYFAGYSGGAKAIMPGVSTREAIQANHSKMVEREARAGNIETNPVRRDIDEITEFISIDFIVNVVLDENKEIIKSVAGHYIDAHRAGCRFLDSFYKIHIPRRADIVITTPGGFPKDLNLYQAQKALDNAKHAVRDGGIIIFAAACAEGFGSEKFEKWINEAQKPEDLICRVKSDFQLGGHKAAAIAMVLSQCSIFMVSDMADELVKKTFMTPFRNIQSALDLALNKIGPGAKVIIMPHGGSTLPVFDECSVIK
jgi:nickel-dependent lactate racemase